ncbi:MAG: HAD family phosphatase [Acidimicrobiia bacterium]|nr:HAD family phosphatase [Acidimicrobiia bacterium]
MTTDVAFEAVIFDFGGVFTASPFAAAALMGAERDIDADTAVLLLFGAYDHDTDHPWHRAERGELDITTCREEIRRLSAAEGTELDLFDLLRYMGQVERGVREDMVARVRRARADGLRTGLLTNNVAEFREVWRPLLPLDEIFDDVVDSSEVGLRKPDPAIYRLAAERLAVDDLSRAVFVDDHPSNVAAAQALGMAGVVIDDPWTVAAERLDTLLGWTR